MTDDAEREVLRLGEDRRLLTIATRHASGERSGVRFDHLNVRETVERYRRISVDQKLSATLELVASRSKHLGHPVSLDASDWPSCYCYGLAELQAVVEELSNLGLVTLVAFNLPVEGIVELTTRGWSEVRKQSSNPNGRVFVAMSFHSSLRTAYDQMEAAISDCGFVALRVDQEHFSEKISDYMLAQIRRAQFVVADVTLEPQNVYYEAGFAQGLGKEIIWTCRSGTKIHFDTSQYPHIEWETEDDLRRRLRDRMRRLFPNAKPAND